MSILTLNDVKTWIGIPDDSQDDQLIPIHLSAEEAIEDFCEAKFSPQVVTNEIHDGVRSDSLLPRNEPIISVSEIRFNCQTDGTGGEVVSTDYYYVDDGEVVFVQRFMPKGRGLVAIDYSWGYASAPEVVKQAVRLTCEAWLRRYEDKTLGSGAPESVSKDREAVTYRGPVVGSKAAWDDKTGLPNEVTAMLSKYRNIEFGGGNTATRNR